MTCDKKGPLLPQALNLGTAVPTQLCWTHIHALEFYFLIPEHHSYVPQARPPAIIKNASAACWLSRAPINSASCGLLVSPPSGLLNRLHVGWNRKYSADIVILTKTSLCCAEGWVQSWHLLMWNYYDSLGVLVLDCVLFFGLSVVFWSIMKTFLYRSKQMIYIKYNTTKTDWQFS